MQRNRYAFALVAIAVVFAFLAASGCGKNEQQAGANEGAETGAQVPAPGEAGDVEPPYAALEGRYVNQGHTCETLELEPDGTFKMVDNHKPGDSVSGRYTLEDGTVALEGEDGSAFMSFSTEDGSLVETGSGTTWKKL